MLPLISLETSENLRVSGGSKGNIGKKRVKYASGKQVWKSMEKQFYSEENISQDGGL